MLAAWATDSSDGSRGSAPRRPSSAAAFGSASRRAAGHVGGRERSAAASSAASRVASSARRSRRRSRRRIITRLPDERLCSFASDLRADASLSAAARSPSAVNSSISSIFAAKSSMSEGVPHLVREGGGTPLVIRDRRPGKPKRKTKSPSAAPSRRDRQVARRRVRDVGVVGLGGGAVRRDVTRATGEVGRVTRPLEVVGVAAKGAKQSGGTYTRTSRRAAA